MTEITFTIPGRLSGLNEHDNKNRTHAQAGGKHKKQQQQKVELAIMAARAPQVPAAWYPLHITFRWHEGNRRRDPDNVAFAKKYILDALQTTGIIEGDGWRHVTKLTDEFRISPENPRIEVILVAEK